MPGARGAAAEDDGGGFWQRRLWRAEAGWWSVLLPASEVLQDSVNLFLLTESLKERQQVQELCVIHVVKPGLDWDLMIREVEHV